MGLTEKIKELQQSLVKNIHEMAEANAQTDILKGECERLNVK